MKSLQLILTILILLPFAYSPEALTQSKWIGTIETQQFEVPYWIVEKVRGKHPDVMMAPATAFIEAAKQEELELDFETTVFAVNSEGDFSALTTSRASKDKFVFDSSTESFHMVQYNKKIVSNATKAEILQFSKKMSGLAAQMQPNIAKAFENADLTEDQKRALAQSVPGFAAMSEPEEPKLEETGAEKSMLDRKVKFFKVSMGEKTAGFWAACDDMSLAATYREMSQGFDDMVSMGEKEKSEEDALPQDYFPIASVKVETRYGVISSINVYRTVHIQPGDPGKEPFEVPGKEEGFEVMSMLDAFKHMEF